MADREIGDLTSATTPLGGDELIHIVQDGDSRQVALSELAELTSGAMLKSTYDPNDDGIIAVAQGGTGSATASGARTNLGLGTMAVQNAATVAITGGSVTGITDLTIADGGTGASDAETARENLGLEIGVDVQAWLDEGVTGQVLTWGGSGPVWGAVAGTGDMVGSNNLSEVTSPSDARDNIGVAIGSDVQAYSANLDTLAGITPGALGQALLADALAADARTTLELGSAALLTVGAASGNLKALNADGGFTNTITANQTVTIPTWFGGGETWKTNQLDHSSTTGKHYLNSDTCTITIATPAVISATAHLFEEDDQVTFTTTGALPTGLSTATTYYVISAGLTADAFQLSATQGGAAINTTGSQSGTHTVSSGSDVSRWAKAFVHVVDGSGGVSGAVRLDGGTWTEIRKRDGADGHTTGVGKRGPITGTFTVTLGNEYGDTAGPVASISRRYGSTLTTDTTGNGVAWESATRIHSNNVTLAYDGQTGNFTAGQVLTGGTSGATATIVSDSDSGTTGTLTLSGVSGTFANNEALTDPLGGAASANGTIQVIVIREGHTLMGYDNNPAFGSTVALHPGGFSGFTTEMFTDDGFAGLVIQGGGSVGGGDWEYLWLHATHRNVATIGGHMTGPVHADGNALLRAGNGSASFPSLSFASDTNLGFYRAGADIIGWGANSATGRGFFGTGFRVGVPVGGDPGSGNISVAGAYYVEGTKVVGDQGAAVADATSEADAVTKLNTLLARLRTHGLIAT